jgi:replicative DNA helicase
MGIMSEAQLEEKFDAKAIEQEMLEAAQNRAVDPAESAAMVYHMYKPELLRRLPKLSTRALRRVFQLVIEHPLNDKALKATTQLEQEVFMLADSMLQSKFVLMMDTYKDGAEQLVNAQDEIFKGQVTETVEFESTEEKGE